MFGGEIVANGNLIIGCDARKRFFVHAVCQRQLKLWIEL